MLVSTATRGSMPKESITNAVSNEAPSVTTVNGGKRRNQAKARPTVLTPSKIGALGRTVQFALLHDRLIQRH
jgi:hypothetical protein